MKVEIRAARVDDHRDIYELLSCPSVVRDTLQLPYVSLDRRRQYLENPEPGRHILVAEVEGRVIGEFGLQQQRNRRSHTATLGMAVHDDFQNRGVGTRLVQAGLDIADNWLNLKRVELQVYTDNAAAVHLYEKFGFIIEGTHKAFAFREGEYIDAYFMARVKP